MENEETKGSMLLPQDKYLEAGLHIGTRFKTIDMKPFIFKRRDDGLFILDLRKIDERIRIAAKMLSKYKPDEVLVVASRLYSANAAGKFSHLTGVDIIKGRFIPGTMTNIKLPLFKEPKIMLVCDPKGEAEAVREASRMGIPIIALCDTDNNTGFIDWVVPTNNKGRKALALVFYLLTRELMMGQGKISGYDQFGYKLEYFERFEDERTEEIAKTIEAEEAKPAETDLLPEEKKEKKEEKKEEEKKEE
ncbi:30S ribosomal protein S2 [Candidatus Micrarchaeota archaeon]|nr:30S ribosomal protein S2 [Candidatus Micrarchaeota archaeon]